MSTIARLKTHARQLKAEVYALYLAARHPDTPWYAKLFLVAIVAYALSPIDLIPDFIPVLGLLDEVILLPFGIVLALKMVPVNVMAECRVRALGQPPNGSRAGRIGALVIVLLWVTLAVVGAIWAHNAFALERGRGMTPNPRLQRTRSGGLPPARAAEPERLSVIAAVYRAGSRERRCRRRSRTLLEPAHADLGRGMLLLAIQSFVLRATHATILIDTCVGEGKARPQIPEWDHRSGGGYLDRLARIGVRPESVDFVVCTHRHLDHVGWNTRADGGRWVPTFPNARYLIGRRELAFWEGERRDPDELAPLHLGAFEDSVLPILESGQAELVDDGYEFGRGMTLMPLPGHTPGQMGLQVDGRLRTLFSGDAIHSPLQVLDASLSPAQARQVRRAVLEDAAEHGRPIVPAHFRGARRMTVQDTATGFMPCFPGCPHSNGAVWTLPDAEA